MCGIVGIVGSNQRSTLEALRRMSVAVAHRGPDDAGEELAATPDGVIGLAHRRLAIIDLSSQGHQPMKDPTTGNWLTYNGEIYNFCELRAELEACGYEFLTRTDTEVILAAYREWGLKALSRLRGMFALGLWDESLQRLILARDPFGIKPLYYYRLGNLFLFASEVRALLASGMAPRRLSLEGLFSYLRFGSVLAPWTAVDGVHSLLPGHYMIVEPGESGLQVEENEYGKSLFSMCSPLASVPTRSEAIATLRETLKESIHSHLISDVPLGVFLSGGIDSSAIVALMSQVTKESPKTFSVVFAEKEFSEAAQGRVVAERFGTDHKEIPLTEQALLEMLPAALRAMDQPSMDGINTYVISKAVKEEGITVALSGLGGDELFAGYESFKRVKYAQMMAKLPVWIRRSVATAGEGLLNRSVRQRKAWELLAGDGSPFSVYSVSRQLFSAQEVGAITKTTIPSTYPPMPSDGFLDDPLNAMSLYELRGYMANTLLRDTDCMSMAHALEVRVPFIDSAVVSYVLSLPGTWKVDGSRPKPLLLDALGELLPEEIWRRPKMGFTLPFKRWMIGALAPGIERVLASIESDISAVGLDNSEVLSVWRQFQEEPESIGWARPWALYVLIRWCELNQVTM